MLLDTADGMVSLLERDIAKAPTLRGKTVATMFFEPSTRTKLSFDKAAKALSADVMSFTASSSSLTKGESLKDTVLTVQALGVDLMIVRHGATGAPWRVAEWVDVPVVNAGDGPHASVFEAMAHLRGAGYLDADSLALPQSAAGWETAAIAVLQKT